MRVRKSKTAYARMMFLFILSFFLSYPLHAYNEQRKKPDPKQVEAVMKKLDRFFIEKRKTDKLAIAKEEKTLDILSMVMESAQPDEWMDYLSYYYNALGELDKAGLFLTPEYKKILDPDPEELLGMYIDDERRLAADNLLKPEEDQYKALMARFDVLDKAGKAGKIRLHEMAGRMYTAAFVYAPSQSSLLNFQRERIKLGSRLRLGEIDMAAYAKTLKEMTKKYNEENKATLKMIKP